MTEKEALEPQKPVAWGYKNSDGQIIDCITPEEHDRIEGDYTIPLYTLPQADPGGKSTHYNIDPAYAPMIAAGRVAEDVISRAIMKAHEIRPYQNQALTPEQKVAWDNLMAVLGDGGRYLEWPSAREISQSAVKAMSDEAIKLLENPSVKLAYEHFQLMCHLTKDHGVDVD